MRTVINKQDGKLYKIIPWSAMDKIIVEKGKLYYVAKSNPTKKVDLSKSSAFIYGGKVNSPSEKLQSGRCYSTMLYYKHLVPYSAKEWRNYKFKELENKIKYMWERQHFFKKVLIPWQAKQEKKAHGKSTR